MKIAVKDANVLIDLEIAGLLDLWFQLGHQTLTTDLVVGQLKESPLFVAFLNAQQPIFRTA